MSISMRHLGLAAAVAFSLGMAGCANDQAAAPAAPPAPAAAPAPVPAPAAAMPAAKPMAGKQLNEAVQTALNANGAKLKVDGSMGPKTRAALRAFQHKHHLRPTGRPDAATLKALGL